MTEQKTEYAVTPYRPQLISNFDEAALAAKAMAQSGYFSDAREVAQAMVKVLAGAEMGFGPFARAMSNGVRWYCPDVFAGSTVYAPDELDEDAPPPDWELVNGEVTEDPPAPQKPEPEPEPQGNGNGDNGNYAAELREGNERPYAAETLRDLIGISVGKKREEGFAFPNDYQRSNYRGALRANLDLCFAGDPHSTQKRHFVTEYLTGKASSKNLDDAEIKTLHRWLNARPDDDTGEWHPDQQPRRTQDRRSLEFRSLRCLVSGAGACSAHRGQSKIIVSQKEGTMPDTIYQYEDPNTDARRRDTDERRAEWGLRRVVLQTDAERRKMYEEIHAEFQRVWGPVDWQHPMIEAMEAADD